MFPNMMIGGQMSDYIYYSTNLRYKKIIFLLLHFTFMFSILALMVLLLLNSVGTIGICKIQIAVIVSSIAAIISTIVNAFIYRTIEVKEIVKPKLYTIICMLFYIIISVVGVLTLSYLFLSL